MINNNAPPYYKRSVPNEAYFKNVHTMVLVSTFPRSGSTLLGYLLTAHRNMVVASEPARKKENLYDGVPIDALMNYILYIDKMRFEDAEKARLSETSENLSAEDAEKVRLSETSENLSALDNPTNRTYNKQDRYIFVPNQWQACCDSLEVIGIKNSSQLAHALLREDFFEKFKKKVKTHIKDYKLKFIFTVRNPYDMIATGIVHRAKHPKVGSISRDKMSNILKKRVKSQFVERCEFAAKVFELMKPERILINRHEDMISNPTEQLRKLCEFLEVSAFPDYLKDCTSVIHTKANKSRYELDWKQEQKEQVAELIEKYHFFSGYSWDL